MEKYYYKYGYCLYFFVAILTLYSYFAWHKWLYITFTFCWLTLGFVNLARKNEKRSK
ncbi:hypothetical protein IGI39_001826 [Enterococcus sp. AZ135]